MSRGMLGVGIREASGPLGELLENLSGSEKQAWRQALKRFLRKEDPWTEVQKAAPSLLEEVATTTVPALPAFDVSARFKVTSGNEHENAEVLIGYMSDNAQRLVQARTEPEPEIAETIVRLHKLLRASVDSPIIAELGGGQIATTTWGQMYEMMRRQGRGQEGVLLTNSYANIFYIPDADGTIWAVDCYWHSGYGDWSVYAHPVTDPGRWDAVHQVAPAFSGSMVLEPLAL